MRFKDRDRLSRALAWGALGLAAALAVATPASAEPATIRVAWIVPASDSPLALLGKQGIARHEGQTYHLQFVHFTSTPAELTGLASDEIDMAPIGFPAFALGIENAGLSDLRVIGDTVQDGVGGGFSNSFFVRNDGPATVEGLRGKVVTDNAIGAAIDIALRVELKQHGLEDKRDYTLIESQFPTIKAELLERKVDLGGLVPPFAFDPELNAKAHVLFTEKDAMGPSELLFLTARKGFIDKNRAALVDFLEDNIREIRWYQDPANHAEAVKLVSTYDKLPPQVFESWFFTAKDTHRDPNDRPDLDALQHAIAVAHEVGVVPAALDPHPYADLTLVEEAAKRLQ